MSQALTLAESLDPEVRLAQAVSNFEKDLSTSQKADLRKQRSQVPQLEDVMRFTAEIDRRMTTKGIRRGYGPRLTSFLEGVQTFVPLGDTLIGGTQGWLGRGIWTVVRFSVQAATGTVIQHSAHMDKLTKIFMEAGRSMPRHQNMAVLFPQSRALQTHLVDYFIVVVKLCHKILLMSQSNGFQQLLDSYSKPLDHFEDQLQTYALAIKDELAILSTSIAISEQKKNSSFRDLMRKEGVARSLRDKKLLRIRILNACSEHNHQILWRQIRKEGTTTFFLDDASYIAWKSNKKSCAYIFSGKLGSGKSVLLANVVDDLHLSSELQGSKIIYFFCHHRIKESLLARTIIGSLARQLLETRDDLQDLMTGNMNLGVDWDIEDLIVILQKAFANSTTSIFLILDGLDECEPDQRTLVVRSIQEIHKSLKISLCISTRWEPDQKPKLDLARLEPTTIFDIPEDHPEMESFIGSEVDNCISTGQMCVEFQDIVPIMKQVLSTKSEGMFLWASLAIKTLCGLSTDQDILQALQDLPLPRNLPEIYIHLLNKSSDRDKKRREAVLQLTAIAVRSLTILELREALSVEPGVTDWNGLKLPNDMSKLLATCGGLIIVDEEELTIRLVHDSARQFLMDTKHSDCPHTFEAHTAETRMAQIIATYLNYVVFDDRVSTHVAPRIMAEPIIEGMLSTSTKAGRFFGPIARRLRGKNNRPAHNLGHILVATARHARSHAQPTRDFEIYAHQYWLEHGVTVLDTDILIQELITHLITREATLQGLMKNADHALVWTIRNGKAKALEILLALGRSNKYPWNDASRAIFDAFFDAAVRGDDKIVQTALDCPWLIMTLQQYSRHPGVTETIWKELAKGRQYDMIRLLSSQQILCVLGTETVKSLLYGDEKFKDKRMDEHESTLFDIAIKNGLIHVDRAYSRGMTPLMYCAKTGQILQLRMLLNEKTIAISEENRLYGNTAVSLAAASGEHEALELLIKLGNADINVPTSSRGFAPIHEAIWANHPAVCRVLLSEFRLNINAKTSGGETALVLAAKLAEEDLVRMILQSSHQPAVEYSCGDNSGETAISWAAQHGSSAMIEMIIEAFDMTGIDITVRSNSGRTPLSLAAQRGDVRCLEALLKANRYGTWCESGHLDLHWKSPIEYASGEVKQLLVATKR